MADQKIHRFEKAKKPTKERRVKGSKRHRAGAGWPSRRGFDPYRAHLVDRRPF
jgi:hypothetical protein